MWQTPQKKRPPLYGQDFMGMGGATLDEADSNALTTYILGAALNSSTGGGGPTLPPEDTGGGGGGATPPPPPPGGTQAGQAQDIWNQMNAIDEHWHPGQTTWVDEYKDMLLNGMIPNAMQNWSYDKIMSELKGNWPLYAMMIARSGFPGGAPVYNRTGDGSTSNLVFVPGFKPEGAPSTMSGTRTEDSGGEYGMFDEAGRYLGHKSGLINGRWVY